MPLLWGGDDHVDHKRMTGRYCEAPCPACMAVAFKEVAGKLSKEERLRVLGPPRLTSRDAARLRLMAAAIAVGALLVWLTR